MQSSNWKVINLTNIVVGMFSEEDYQIKLDSDDISESDTIYRYFDFPGILDLLFNKRLLLTRTDKFEDKFEGSFTQYIYQGLKILWLEKEGDRYSFQDLFNEECNRIKRHSYVSSWSLAQKENISLWKLFGKSNNAIAIKSNVCRLKKSLEDGIRLNNSAFYSLMKKRIVKVEYIDHNEYKDYKKFLSNKDKTYILKIKNEGYRFEEELRVLFDVVNVGHSAIARHLGEKCHVTINHHDLIQELVVSPLADEWFFDLLMKLNLEVKCKWSDLKFTPYEKMKNNIET